MKLILVRHGITLDNLTGICQGQREVQLSKEGVLEANLTRILLESFHIDICFSSDLKRALQTAHIISDKRGLKIVKEATLRERHLGLLQGKHFPKNWRSSDNYKGAETITDLYERVALFIKSLKAYPKDSVVLIVSHGITLKLIICYLLNADLNSINNFPNLQNCSITVIEEEKYGSYKIIDYNNTNHLKLMPMK